MADALMVFLIMAGLCCLAIAIVGLWHLSRPVPCPPEVERDAWESFVARYNGRTSWGQR